MPPPLPPCRDPAWFQKNLANPALYNAPDYNASALGKQVGGRGAGPACRPISECCRPLCLLCTAPNRCMS